MLSTSARALQRALFSTHAAPAGEKSEAEQSFVSVAVAHLEGLSQAQKHQSARVGETATHESRVHYGLNDQIRGRTALAGGL